MERWVCVSCWTAAARPLALRLGTVELASAEAVVTVAHWPCGICQHCYGSVVNARDCQAVHLYVLGLPLPAGTVIDYARLATQLAVTPAVKSVRLGDLRH